MGAGNKLDPTKFVITDIYKTTTCPLAAVIRRECRKSGVRRLKVVYSTEEAQTPEFAPEGSENSRKRTPASAAFTPAVCGLMLASAVVEDLVHKELSRSLEMRKNND
jgi:tRNA A37 threonylcarbamoyladenosine dehydratase